MPLPFLISSSDGFVAGGQYTRFKGMALSGTLGSTVAGPLETPAGVALVQAATNTSTAGARAQVLSTLAAAISAASYVYIPLTTGSIATSSFAAGASAPPYTGCGAALIWDAGTGRLGVFSTVDNQWLFIGGSTSTGIAGTFTSQSS